MTPEQQKEYDKRMEQNDKFWAKVTMQQFIGKRIKNDPCPLIPRKSSLDRKY